MMKITSAIDILTGKTVANNRAEIDKAEKMATHSLELWNEFESLVDYSFDADEHKYSPDVIIAINDFKRMIKSCKDRIEKEV